MIVELGEAEIAQAISEYLAKHMNMTAIRVEFQSRRTIRVLTISSKVEVKLGYKGGKE